MGLQQLPGSGIFPERKSLGEKGMPVHSHLEWKVPLSPGLFRPKATRKGRWRRKPKEETTGEPVSVALVADRDRIKADGEDVSVVTVEARDRKGRPVPTASNEV